jgi:hypothetical protein
LYDIITIYFKGLLKQLLSESLVYQFGQLGCASTTETLDFVLRIVFISHLLELFHSDPTDTRPLPALAVISFSNRAKSCITQASPYATPKQIASGSLLFRAATAAQNQPECSYGFRNILFHTLLLFVINCDAAAAKLLTVSVNLPHIQSVWSDHTCFQY